MAHGTGVVFRHASFHRRGRQRHCDHMEQHQAAARKGNRHDYVIPDKESGRALQRPGAGGFMAGCLALCRHYVRLSALCGAGFSDVMNYSRSNVGLWRNRPTAPHLAVPRAGCEATASAI
ncbi:hypothetical protein CNECB9_5280003 [Cupriavidus necator]|uniref:Uncharacterized protein n=1 Tax=Cupriavidus necator TaxID=106590 RepID=A0A1K0IPP9_CUPNE|nr:hypothetical protein CNECB9_5280003 [Cupriavidus necator]